MKVIIPVAGYGTRLRPHTHTMQKTLIPVAGKPALDHIIDPLIENGLENIVLIIGHLGHQVRDHLTAHRGQFDFVEQTERLGLGHAVLQGLENSNEPVLVQLGDAIFDVDYPAFLDTKHNRVAVMEVEDPRRFGVVEHTENRVIQFHEKVENPPSNLALAGLYYFSRESALKSALEILVQEGIKTKGEYQLTDAMELMLKDGAPFDYFKIKGWYDVGVPQTVLETNRILLTSKYGEYPGTIIHDPVHIGENCQIKQSEVGPNVTIMDHCSVENCRIENSVILPGATLNNLTIHSRIVGGDGSQQC